MYEFLATKQFKFRGQEVVREFKASKEFKKEWLALMKVARDQIVNKIYKKRLGFNTDFPDEESEKEDDGEDAGDGDDDDVDGGEV